MANSTTRRARTLKLRIVLVAALAALLAWLVFREPDVNRIPVDTLADLEEELEALRARLRIPGMSAVIAEDGRVVWARGFGTANVERGIPAGPDTIYHLASLAKPYASTVLLQLVEEGRLPLPYALGWFVQQHRGHKLAWHYGHGLESSSLIVKIPDRRVTPLSSRLEVFPRADFETEECDEMIFPYV